MFDLQPLNYLMFSCEPSKKYYLISFTSDVLNESSQKILYEDDLILIDRTSIENFCQFFQVVLTKKPYIIKIKYSDLLTKINLIENKSKIAEYIRKRYKQAELGACFFKKYFFPQDYTLKPYQKDGIEWLLNKKGRLLADDDLVAFLEMLQLRGQRARSTQRATQRHERPGPRGCQTRYVMPHVWI